MHKIYNKAFVYLISFPNNKKYVGRWTGNFNKLLARYSCNKNARYVERAIIKYGFNNVKFEIIEEFFNISNDDLNQKEIHWIQFYHSNKSQKGYNITKGGEGHPVDLSSRESISKKAKLRLQDKNNHPLFGTKVSEKSKQKMSLAKKGFYIQNDNPNWKDYIDKTQLEIAINKKETFLLMKKKFNCGQKLIEKSLQYHFGSKSLKIVRAVLGYPSKEDFEQMILNNTYRSFAKIGFYQSRLKACLKYYYNTESLIEIKDKLTKQPFADKGEE